MLLGAGCAVCGRAAMVPAASGKTCADRIAGNEAVSPPTRPGFDALMGASDPITVPRMASLDPPSVYLGGRYCLQYPDSSSRNIGMKPIGSVVLLINLCAQHSSRCSH